MPTGVPRRTLEVHYEAAAQEYLRKLKPEHFMEATTRATQRKLTVEGFDLVTLRRADVHCFSERLVQYDVGRHHRPGQVAPDNMVVVHDGPIDAIGHYSLRLQPAAPLWVMEYVSQGSKRKDYVGSMTKYEHRTKVPYYLIYYPDNEDLSLFRHDGRRYVSVLPNEAGLSPVPELEMAVGLVDGWARFWFRGEMLPLPADLQVSLDRAQQQAEQARQQAGGRGRRPPGGAAKPRRSRSRQTRGRASACRRVGQPRSGRDAVSGSVGRAQAAASGGGRSARLVVVVFALPRGGRIGYTLREPRPQGAVVQRCTLWIACAALALAGCADAPTPPSLSVPELAPMGEGFDAARSGTIAGKVAWRGDVPVVPSFRSVAEPFAPVTPLHLAQPPVREYANPNAPQLASAVVFLRGVDPSRSRPWDHPPTRVEIHKQRFAIAQRGERLVGFVRAGEEVKIVSRDSLFHSVQGRGAAFLRGRCPRSALFSRYVWPRPASLSCKAARGTFGCVAIFSSPRIRIIPP